jgi:hypothetical protein
MVEHVKTLCSVFSWNSFSGSEDEVTSPPPQHPVPSGKDGMRKRAPARCVSIGLEGLQGTGSSSACVSRVADAPAEILVCISPEFIFLGSEGEDTSLQIESRAWSANHGCKYERRLTAQAEGWKGSRELRLCFSQN